MAIPRIYTAVYSGVAVYEMVVNDVAIMRRRVDSHMNATQILKVAGIEKGRRTKILEREILPGEHEKVQGGYGKFQGTWIPLGRCIELAKQYQVYDLVKSMMEFDPATSGTIDEKRQVPTKEQAQLYDRQIQPKQKKRKLAQSSSSVIPPLQYQQQPPHQSRQYQPQKYEQDQMSHQPLYHQPWQTDNQSQHQQQHQQQHPHAQQRPYMTSDNPAPANDNPAYGKHCTILMSIFLTDDSGSIADLLKTTKDIDINMVLDEQGNTALHWAASLGRYNTVEQLAMNGADINRQNYSGETALMRSVAATNNFDRDCFRRLLKLLDSSLHVNDHKRRTVIHHTAITAGVHGREMAALYYMHNLLERLDKPSSTLPGKVAFLDAQDDQGDTAMNIAARLDCQRMIDLLVDAGANKLSENNLGLAPNDYIMGTDKQSPEVEKPAQENEIGSPSLHPPPNAALYPTLYSKRSTSSIHRGKEIVATVQKIVDALDEEYGDQLSHRESQLKDMERKLEETNAKLEGARKDLEKQQEKSQHLAEAQQKVRHLNLALETGWNELGGLLQNDNATLDRTAVLELDVDQDIDVAFKMEDINQEGVISSDQSLVKLKARIDAYILNNNTLKAYADGLRTEKAEKEMQCKRLIAACCNLPIDKIDELVEPLTLAIESDPPDLDLGRVIGFMEKIRRQGTFHEAAATLTHPDRSLKAPSLDSLPQEQNIISTSHIRNSPPHPDTNSP